MANSVRTRADDELVLAMLHHRRHVGCAAIAKHYGLRKDGVRVMTNRIVTDDSAAEGRCTRAEYAFVSAGETMRMAARS